MGDNLAPLHSRLVCTLKKHGLLYDEKEWIDRAVYDVVKLHHVVNTIETLLDNASSKVQQERQRNERQKNEQQLKRATNEKSIRHLDIVGVMREEMSPMDGPNLMHHEIGQCVIYPLINQCFEPIDQEVRLVTRSSTQFTPTTPSLLSKAIAQLKQSAALDERRRSQVCKVALHALASYRHLYRRLVPFADSPFKEDVNCPSKKPPTKEDGRCTSKKSLGLKTNDDSYRAMDEQEIAAVLDQVLCLCDSSTTTTANPSRCSSCFELRSDPQWSVYRGISTLLAMPKPVVVPGGRFREAYYWDSYWIIRGLCCAGRVEDAKNIVINFSSAIDRFGFVPNGSRSYYLDRSQPALLSECFRVVYEALNYKHNNENARNVDSPSDEAYELLTQALPRLMIDYFSFWMNPKTKHLVLLNSNNKLNSCPHRNGNAADAAHDVVSQNQCRCPHSCPDVDDACDAVEHPIHWILKNASTLNLQPDQEVTGDLGKQKSGSSIHPGESNGGEPDTSMGYLNRYYSSVTQPRLESHTKDSEVVRDIELTLQTDPQIVASGSVEGCLQSVRAAAESGFDFSSRWARSFILGNAKGIEGQEFFNRTSGPLTEAQREVLRNQKKDYFRQIDTINVIPVDLNSILYRYELNVAEFARILANRERTGENGRSRSEWIHQNDAGLKLDPQGSANNRGEETRGVNEGMKEKLMKVASVFQLLASQRRSAMKRFLWDSNERVWRDFYLKSQSQSQVISMASVIALWAGLSDDEPSPVNIHSSLFKGWGLVPTPNFTGQQWDSPNVWPPLVHFAVEYLDRTRQPGWRFDRDPSDVAPVNANHVEIGRRLACSFLCAASQGLARCQARGIEGGFYEKYNSLDLGQGGSGGEYPNQVGFGWTNACVIEFVSRYHDWILLPAGGAPV